MCEKSKSVSTIPHVSNLSSILKSGDWCSPSLRQYACASGTKLTSRQLSSILTCYITDPTALLDQGAFLLLFQQVNSEVLQTALNEISVQVRSDQIASATKAFMLNAAWEVVKSDPKVANAGFLASWFQETLHAYLPSIGTSILDCMAQLPVTCDGLATVVRGLDYAFDDMATDTKTDITQWIVQTLPRLDCQMDENWMTLNFQRFRSIANITDFVAAYENFTGMALLEELTAIQLAQLTLSQDVFSSVANIERIFDRLTKLPGLHELATYWDELNSALEEPFTNTFNISMAVKRTMLARTVAQLRSALPTFTDNDYHLWFQKRLVAVLPGIHAPILQDIPNTISCSSYKSLIAGINTVFSEIPAAGKTDVYNYIVAFLTQQSELTGAACSTHATTRDWLLQFFGKFCTAAPYTQLVSLYRQPFNAYAILDLLTPTQIGDMMVYSDTLTSMDAAVQLVQFFQQSEAEDVQMILTQFTKAASMRKITVLPNYDIARLLLLQYLTSTSEQMKTYTASDWNITFQNELYFLRPVINESTLALIVPQDYDSLVAVVTALDDTYQHMTESSRRDTALWIARNLQILKDGPPESSTEWIKVTWKSFFHNIALQEVIATHNSFDPAKILDVLSTEQLVEYALTSDALVNVTTMQDILNALRGENPQISEPKMSEFLVKFNLALTQEGIGGIRNDEIRMEMLTTLFTDLSKHFYKFADLDYELWFLESLRFLLPSINTDLLELIPGDLSFPAYTAIVRGLDNVFPELPQNTSHAIYLFIKRILESQLTFSDKVFPGTYDSSRSFLELIFYRFLHFAPYSDLTDFYKDFNGYEVLDLLSARQIGEMTVLTNAFKRERLTVQILLEMEKRSFEELTEFTKELNAAAEERDLTVLPDPRIRELLFDLLFKSLPFSTFTANEYAFWFGSELQLFLPAMNDNYLQLLPLDIDCQSHQNLVQAMDRVYEHYTDEQRLSIHRRIHNFLETYRNTQGVTCFPNASSSIWIAANYGYFSAHATLHEFSSLNPNFNGMSALGKLSPAQLAQLMLETGALADETSVITIMDNLGTPSDLAKFFATLNDMASMDVLEKLSPPQLASLTLSSDAINEEEEMCQILAKLHNKPSEEIYQFLDQFNRDAAQFNVRDNLTTTQLAHVFFDPGVLDDTRMVETLLGSLEGRPALDISAFVAEFVATASQEGLPTLANAQVRDAMFRTIFHKLRGQFPTFSVSQYKDWFQNKLSLWLGSINASALAAIPRNIPCRIYQIIMSGLEGSFQQMSPASHQDVYSFAKSYLSAKASQGGGPCVENTRGSLDWLQTNLGSFSSLATYRDLTDMNADFGIVDAVAGLTPEQLAAYTLASDVLRDIDKAGKVFSSLSSHTIGDFMDAFNEAAMQRNLSQLPHGDVRRFILGQIFCHLSTVFELFSTEDYIAWFGGRLGLFLSSLNAQNLGFLPSDMTCNSLAAIVKILNEHKAKGPYENPEHIYSFIKRVLHFQLQNSGSACTQGTAADREWLLQYFGLFTAFGSYSDFATLKRNFHGHDSLDLFSAEALAQLTVQSKTIYSPSAIQMVLEVIGNKEEPLQYLSAFLEDFNTFVLKFKVPDLNTPEEMAQLTVNSTLTSLEDTLSILAILECGSYDTINRYMSQFNVCARQAASVKGFNIAYESLSPSNKIDIYNSYIKTYLSQQSHSTADFTEQE
ncbi:PREDICTED: uncharacterized protein LOC104295156 [Charadrius vociferus]|uniref:uncharacterized protein LOC104295156 n=1 Tax=Charadrius vociferus TaxID=50402 RepID=UPI000521442C|nr:PREDICTED: uncharacterized protein LOC104295156 [Charadrius vociferus]